MPYMIMLQEHLSINILAVLSTLSSTLPLIIHLSPSILLLINSLIIIHSVRCGVVAGEPLSGDGVHSRKGSGDAGCEQR